MKKLPKISDIRPLYVVMHDGCDGPLASLDSGNPFHTFKGAREARARLGKVRAPIYYIVRFEVTRISAGKLKAK